jgi:hypothetical protein
LKNKNIHEKQLYRKKLTDAGKNECGLICVEI